jgi:hypothetical protein
MELGGGAIKDWSGEESSSDTADLVGEKLTSSFIQAQAKEFAKTSNANSFIVLPLMNGEGTGPFKTKPQYVVLFESSNIESDAAQWWESKLSTYYHYGYARKLGQLDQASAYKINGLQSSLLNYYIDVKKMKAGDVKIPVLISKPEESQNILDFLKIQLTEESKEQISSSMKVIS